MATSAEFQTVQCYATFAGTSVLGVDGAAIATMDNQISPSGSYIADLAAITDGPAGFSGPGSVSLYEVPVGSGQYVSIVYEFGTGLTSTNYWAAGAWIGWSDSSGLSPTQYADVASLPDPASTPAGTLAAVMQDPSTALNGLYMSNGVVGGATSTGWTKQ